MQEIMGVVDAAEASDYLSQYETKLASKPGDPQTEDPLVPPPIYNILYNKRCKESKRERKERRSWKKVFRKSEEEEEEEEE